MANIHGFGKPAGTQQASSSIGKLTTATSAASPAKVMKKPFVARPSCAVKNCKVKVPNIMGLCDLCSVSHCNKHRVPEAHSCGGLEKAKAEARKKQEDKTLAEATKGDNKMVNRI